MVVDNTSYYLKIVGRILLVLGLLAIPLSIFSWSALDFLFEYGDWWDYHWHSWIPIPHITRFLMIFPGMYFLGGIIFIIGGIGLINERSWGQRFAWVPAVIVLFNFPIGTALGVWLIYLLQKSKEFQSQS